MRITTARTRAWTALLLGLALATTAAPVPARGGDDATAATATTATTAAERRLDFTLLDAMAEQVWSCEQAAEKEYWSGVPRRMKASLEIQITCLEEVAVTLAEAFYPPDAFGPGGIRGRIDELRAAMQGLYQTVHTKPLTCRSEPCGEIYEVWALESTVTAVRSLVDAMIDRLKDQSPLHTP